MKKRTAIRGVVAIAVLGFIAIIALNPLRKSPERIRASLLAATPLDSSVADVRATVERKFGKGATYYPKTGFMKREIDPKIVGSSSLEMHLGEYRELPIPLSTDVTAFWGFDGNGRLIDVWVWKTTDGP